MAILFHWGDAILEYWHRAFEAAGCGTDIRTFDAPGNHADVEFAVVWAPPAGGLKAFPNLKYIFSIGAGVTHITLDPEWPSQVPIVRLQDRHLVLDMSCHIIHWVLHFHRFYARYARQQAANQWLRHRYPENSERRVSILGLGQTGQDACIRLRDLEFPVTGWARTPKSIEGVRCLAGDAALDAVVSGADILVNLLPLTESTANILNASIFDRMPEGSFVINCGRGSSINDSDLLAALDSGRIEAAALDVFREEPLPKDSPFWRHPAVSVTPHSAAPTNERSAAEFIAAQIRLGMDGGTPAPIVDLERGY
ncbi:MAG: glyoxylate/hydroxypyruvate reductase A [Albidovulum sp.]|nr:glyoxylate/hydroxypyruvate reductase A [Albidovulum sp.]